MRRATVPVLFAILAGLAGCGIPLDRQAQPLTDVPFGLSDPEPSPEPQSPAPVAGSAVQIFLIDSTGGRLVPVERMIEDSSMSAVAQLLVEGATRAETSQGLASAVAEQEEAVRSAGLVGGVAAVDLALSFTSLDVTRQRLAIAQLVMTLTGRPGVGRVSFTLEGQPVDVPRGDGTLVAGSVSRDDYREVSPT
ncbi:MAG: GerMN domain-containing protein [Actinomycetota bacterium]